MKIKKIKIGVILLIGVFVLGNRIIPEILNINQNTLQAAVIDINLQAEQLGKTAKPYSENQGIRFFEGSWKEALALAKKENKLIFMDAYASWCGPCKLMKARVFSNSKAGDFYNENFINIAMNMERGEGRTLSQKYRIRAYPTLLFIDRDGEVKKIAVGYHNTSQLLKLGKQALK